MIARCLKKTLQQAVNGPLLLAEERPQTSDARNKVFELVMAARLREAGFKPRFAEPADAVVTVDGITCSLECKRIQSEAGLAEALAKAYSQIKQRIGGNPRERGLIAVDISKVVNPTGKKYFNARSYEHLARIVEHLLSSFVEGSREKFRKGFYARIATVFIYLRTPGVVAQEGDHLANYRRLAILPSFINDGKNWQVLRFLRKRLEGAPK
jgi:hypothetical protein